MVASVLLPLVFTYHQWQVQCDPMSSFNWWDVAGIVDKISCNHVGFSPPRGYVWTDYEW